MYSKIQIENTTTERSRREIIDQAEDSPEIEAWQQLPEESGKAYHTFRLYLQAGTRRSLRNLTSVLGKDEGYVKQLEKWSSMYNWNARAGAWDAHVDKLIERQYIESALTMVDRHIRQAHDIRPRSGQEREGH